MALLGERAAVAGEAAPPPPPANWQFAAKSAVRAAFGIVWAIDALMKWQPGFAAHYVGYLQNASQGQPGWLAPWFQFWLALVTPRQALFDRLLPHPFLRKVVYRLPKSLQPAPQRYSFVLALDAQGHVIGNFQNGASDCYSQIANVVEYNGTLYFGSIGEDSLGRFTLR